MHHPGVNHFVVASDGQKYGPADVPTLNTWIAAGRLYPQSTLEEEGTGRRLLASALPGLQFAAIPPPDPLAAYPRPGQMPGAAYPGMAVDDKPDKANFLWGIGLGSVSLLLTIFLGRFLIIGSLFALWHSWKAKSDDDHPLWWLAMIVSVLAVLAAALTFLPASAT